MSDKEKSLDDLLTTRDYFAAAAQELQAGNQRIKKLEKHIKRLEEAGDEMAQWLNSPRNLGGDSCLVHQWNEAKEAKL